WITSDWPNWFVAFRDLRNTGKPDLVTLTKRTRSALRVNLNDGAGRLLGYSLSSSRAWGVPADAFQAGAIADLDGDGEPDGAVSVTNQPWQLRILRGLGGGRFGPQLTVSLGPYGEASGDGVAIADLDADGRQEIIVADP